MLLAVYTLKWRTFTYSPIALGVLFDTCNALVGLGWRTQLTFKCSTKDGHNMEKKVVVLVWTDLMKRPLKLSIYLVFPTQEWVIYINVPKPKRLITQRIEYTYILVWQWFRILFTYDTNISWDSMGDDQYCKSDSMVSRRVVLSIDMKNRQPSILYSSRGFLCPKLLTFTCQSFHVSMEVLKRQMQTLKKITYVYI